MTNIIADRVKESTTTTGTGAVTLSGAAQGYRAFSAVCADGDIVPYIISLGSDYEVGVGRYNSAGPTLSRLEVHASSNANALVNFAAGSKDVALTIVARQIEAISVFPITANVMLRYSVRRSQTDLDTNGYVTKLYDISGNARHSDVVTAKPKYLDRCFNNKFPGLRFNGSSRVTFSALPGLGAPLAATIVFIVQNCQGASGNGHLYNWSGNPIGFGPSSPMDFMYNGTLPAAHPAGNAVNLVDLPPQFLGHPAISIHAFAGVASVQSINGREVTVSPGTGATGATNSFTVGSDSAAGPGNFSKLILAEFAVISGTLTGTDRTKLVRYAEAEWGIKSP